jgi:phage regulator Rha-like protein
MIKMPESYLSELRRSWNRPFDNIRERMNADVQDAIEKVKKESARAAMTEAEKEITDAIEAVQEEWKEKHGQV